MHILLQYRLIVLTNIAQEQLRLHHLQYRFLKISGGGPPDPPPKARLASLDGPPFVPRKLLSGLTCMGPIDVFCVIRCRSKYHAVAGDTTQGVYLYRPSGMARGSNTDSATVAW